MRLVDADALIAEYDRVHIGKPGKARQLMVNAPTIELSCEECEAFNKTRLIIPQPERKRGKWIPHKEISREYIGTVLISVRYDYWLCDACGYRVENGQPLYNFCPNCGARMEP